MSKRTFPILSPDSEDGRVSYHVAADLSQLSGKTLVIGETVFLSDEGVAVLSSQSGQFESVSAYNFVDGAGQVIGGLYARDDAGQNVVGLRATDAAESGDDTTLYVISEAQPGATAVVQLGALLAGENEDTYISLERSESASEIDLITEMAGGRVRVAPQLQLLGAGYAVCDLYIKGSYLIIKYIDGGTTRYKYLDLSGTGTAWQQGTSEP
jgi:hypothetical protein